MIVAERSIEVGPPRFEWKDGTRIVNHTSKELTLFKLQYVDLDHPSLGGDFSEEVIAPHTTVTVHHKIHWVGPDHPPPYLVSLKSGDKGRRWWLTW